MMYIGAPRRSAAVFLSSLAFSIRLLGADGTNQLAEADHWKRVKAECQQRLHANASDAEAYYLLSKAAVSFGNIEDAVVPAEKAVALAPSNPDYHAAAAEAYARMAQRVSVLKQVLYLHKLKRELDAAFALDPTNLDASLVQMMFSWKAPGFAGGDRGKALQVIAQLKSSHLVWGYLAEARLFEDQDAARTQRALEQAVAIDPRFYLASVSLAEFYAETGQRLSDAEQIAKRCIVMDAGRSAAYGVLARVYAREHRYDELDQVLRESERRVPDDLSPYFFAAQTLVTSRGDQQRADRYAHKYLSQPPEGRAPDSSQARQILASLPRTQAHAGSQSKPGI
jgi:tetratricopeptide (TPR) repeat protein